jgi:hypothetical protein
MNIPADAVIATDKLTGYLLIARPLDDKSKFLAGAGFTQSNFEILEAAIRNLATVAPAEEDGRNDYGIFWPVAGADRHIAGRDSLAPVAPRWPFSVHHAQALAKVNDHGDTSLSSRRLAK